MELPFSSPLFAKGFRPFFLAASLLGAGLVAAWLAVLFAGLSLTGLSAVLWHGHEMVYGFALAVVAGFLLTAVGNWTGRETATGPALAGLVLLWALGRVGVWVGPGPWFVPARLVELAFLPVLTGVLGRRLIAARSWRNAGFPALLAGLWLCDLAWAFGPSPAAALSRAVDLLVIMIAIVGGRVVPMFTRNATGCTDVTQWPLLDGAALVAVVATLVAAAAGASGAGLAAFEAASAALVAARMVPWRTHRTFRHPLVWVLHLGQGWIAVGFALRALFHAAGIGLETLGLHAHTTGAIGVTTLGMMARVALGHTGRPLVAPPGVAAAFGLVGLAALVRVLPALLWADAYRASLLVSGLLFAAAQLLYLVAFVPILTRPRIDGRPG